MIHSEKVAIVQLVSYVCVSISCSSVTLPIEIIRVYTILLIFLSKDMWKDYLLVSTTQRCCLIKLQG